MPPAQISDADLKTLFAVVDSDGSGDVSISELTLFVWGVEGAPTARVSARPERSRQAAEQLLAEAQAAASATAVTETDLRRMRKQLQSLSYRAGAAGADPAVSGLLQTTAC
jgi:hypothetical protein